ncbi:MAG: PAS domain-containing protein, partial [Faecalibacterium sp.]|nr:PAS domain-containing protein [Faecalibacterium sp.]
MERHDTLLVACGTAENRKTLCSILDEHYNLLQASNVQQMLLLLEQNSGCIAAVLLDATGFDHKNKALFEQPEIQMLLKNKPVIVIVQDESPEVCNLVFRYGATDVIPLHYDPYAMLRRIENIVELNVHKNHLEVLVEEQAAILRHSNDTMVDALSSIIEYRSVESGQHILRIRHFTKILLEEVVRSCPEYKLTEADVQIISSAAALHDVGKISIPDAILKKPGKLTEEEMEIMRGHTLTGCHILQRLGDLGNKEYMRYAHNICHYHHERWDGNGYPEGLSGEAIPICAQVVGLADVYDALTTKRVYKDAYSFDTAVNMILNGECGVFSPKLLECFKHVTSKYEALARAYADGLSPATETFDTILSPAEETRTDDSIERTWAKYQALVHYCNVFLLELDLGQGLFHLIYNPYPELIDFHDVSTLGELRQKVLQQLVHPTQKQKLEQLLNDDLNSFLQQGLRRANYRFRFCSAEYPQGEWFELTLLRINPTDKQRKSLAVLCRKLEQQADADAGRLNVESESISLADSSYCCVYDDDFTLVRLEGRPGQLMGYTAKELNETFGNRLIELVVPEDRAQVRREIRRQLGMGNDFRLEYRMRHKNGTVFWVLEKSHLWAGADGKEYLSSSLFDISSTKETVERLNRKLDRYEIILAQTENVLFEWDIPTDHVVFSETWEKLFGFDPVSGSADTALRNGSFFHPDDLPRLLDRIRDLRSGSTYEMAEVRVITAKGRYLWCRFRASAIRDEAGNLIKIVGIIINIDADKQAERALQHRAERDSLTGLLNKQAGIQQAEEYLTQYAHGTNCAVLII